MIRSNFELRSIQWKCSEILEQLELLLELLVHSEVLLQKFLYRTWKMFFFLYSELLLGSRELYSV